MKSSINLRVFPPHTLVLVAALASACLWAQERQTLDLAPGAASPPAQLADLAWLQGSWRGESIMGDAEEVYSAPAGGAMMGMFRLTAGERVRFYEFITLVEEAGSLVLRLKHFGPDLVGWEERAESAEFPLVRVEEDSYFFDGLTIRRHGRDRMTVIVLTGSSGGKATELEFNYHRVGGSTVAR
ncbi:DUF6265 family protein [Haliea sp. E17]|uniref:DUF6265 family protein n=1 Tax=Haliea sp. E17 TaxID=3401576 RepID=UPI003AAE5918